MSLVESIYPMIKNVVVCVHLECSELSLKQGASESDTRAWEHTVGYQK